MLMDSRSIVVRTPSQGDACPEMSLIASRASMPATVMTAAPTEGTGPSGSLAVPRTSLSPGVLPGTETYSWPWSPETPAWTSGIPILCEWSSKAILASNESRQSTMTSHPANMSPFSGVTGSLTASTSAAGFSARIHSAEITDFGRGSPAV